MLINSLGKFDGRVLHHVTQYLYKALGKLPAVAVPSMSQ